jgi:hypothetical protein
LQKIKVIPTFKHTDAVSTWPTWPTSDVLAPTLEEVAALQTEVDDEALTKAIESVKSTVRLSGRHRLGSKKVQENKAAQQAAELESESE